MMVTSAGEAKTGTRAFLLSRPPMDMSPQGHLGTSPPAPQVNGGKPTQLVEAVLSPPCPGGCEVVPAGHRRRLFGSLRNRADYVPGSGLSDSKTTGNTCRQQEARGIKNICLIPKK